MHQQIYLPKLLLCPFNALHQPDGKDMAWIIIIKSKQIKFYHSLLQSVETTDKT